MFKLLDRYLLLPASIATSMGILLLSCVLVLGNLFKEIFNLLINYHIPFQILMTFAVSVLPFSLTFTIPWGFLIAILLLFGQLSADHEIIAFRSLGINFMRITCPIFVLSIILSFMCLWINLEIAPKAQSQMMRLLFEIATKNPARFFQSDEIIDKLPDRRIYVGNREGDIIKNIILFELEDQLIPSKVIFAKEGTIISDETNQQLLLKVQNAYFEQRDTKNPFNTALIRQGITIEEGVFPISLKKFFDQKKRNKPLTSYTFYEILSELFKKKLDRRLAFQVELNKRFSVSLAPLSFVLIAVPLSIKTHRKETFMSIILSMMIAFSYFFFTLLADTLKDQPESYPIFLIWLPNILFIFLGMIFFKKLLYK